MDGALEKMLLQHPNRNEQIRQLWMVDEEFRDLCRDYVLCLETLVELAGGTWMQTNQLEYRSLCRRLKLEIELKTEEQRS